MSNIRSSGTRPEKEIRKLMKGLVDLPMKFNVASILGKPDLVILSLKLAIFVDGCFWHGCPQHGNMPKSNKTYWTSKIIGNMARDEANTVELEENGWTVWRVWEHDLKPDTVANTRRRLKRRLDAILGRQFL